MRVRHFILIGILAVRGRAGADIPAAAPLAVTNVVQLRDLASQDPSTNYSFQVEADVWWANPAQGRLVLHDASATEEIAADLSGEPVSSGDRVLLTGNGTIVRRGGAFLLGVRGPVVDNDGIHSRLEKSGAVYLTAGRHPLALGWFNGLGKFELSVEVEGSGLSRQKIPDSWVRGLEYRCYEGAWGNVPDFKQLTPVKVGKAANLDLRPRTRDTNVALQFEGFLEAPREGMFRIFLKSDDGSSLFIGEPTLGARVVGRTSLPPPRQVALGESIPDDIEGGQWAQVEGKVVMVRKQNGGLRMELRSGSGSLVAEVADDAGLSDAGLLNSHIRATGFCQSTFDLDGERVWGLLLVPGAKQIQQLQSASSTDAVEVGTQAQGLPLLSVASAVRELRPQEARRGYPLRIRGVVTAVQPERQAFVIQDSTIGLYVLDASARSIALPEIGDFIEIDGVTDEPGIARLHHLKHLGRGNLPEPVHPIWDQLMNGSLDSQWIEIGGLVESLIDRSNGWSRVMLRSRAGILKVDVRKAGIKPGPLEQYENAVVRLRGCMFADWHPTLRLKVGQIRMYDADVIVDQPAPADVYSLPKTTAAALMQFDPAFDVSRRVRVGVQVVYARGADYFTMDGRDGLRFQARQPLGFEPGDLVEAVGFPELSGAAPVLRGAVARKTGHAPLPEAASLSPDDLIRANLDSTRVLVEGLLTGLKQTPTNLVLDMQAGSWRFLARLNAPGTAPAPRIGSRLALTGVYCAQGGYQALGVDVAPVDLLLGSASDIRVLTLPPWWTLQRLVIIVGVLACAVTLMVLWITQLRRQVEERTLELAAQIQHREHVEHQRAMEQERTRIAQDLHDQLGSDIATVSMLASRAQFTSAPDDKRNEYMNQVRRTSREMVASLDEIVWAMNPGHDSLASLESYLGSYANRFLGLANITWRFEGPSGAGDRLVDSRQRHQLFLAFKEALTNVVRHSGAGEVRLKLQVDANELRLDIADNGRGLSEAKRTDEMDGVANMRARIEKLHGRFEIDSEPEHGTTVRFRVPLITLTPSLSHRMGEGARPVRRNFSEGGRAGEGS